MSVERRPKWMTAWRYFIADAIVPLIGGASLFDQMLWHRDGFSLERAAVAFTMTAGGPGLVRWIESRVTRRQ